MIEPTSTIRADALSALPFPHTAVAKPNVRRAGERFGEAGAEAPSPTTRHRRPRHFRQPRTQRAGAFRPQNPIRQIPFQKNAVTHGLRAKRIDNAVAPGLRAEYEALRQQYLDEYKPTGAIESTLLDLVIFAAWQLYKIREMELFTDIDLGAPGSFGRSEKLARYRGSHEQLLFRSLNQLKQIQQERALLSTDKSAALPAHIPPAVRLKPLFNHLKSLAHHPKTLSASAIPRSAAATGRAQTRRHPRTTA